MKEYDNMKRVFCENCGDKPQYNVTTKHAKKTIQGVTFFIEEEIAICSDCGEAVYVPEVHDANIDRIDAAYREAVGIISLDEIKLLMKKYAIGANPLSKVLGFGEVTIARYLAGQTPSKSCSDRLREVLNSEEEMEKCLIRAQNDISPTAFKKCKVALDQMKMHTETEEKIELVAQYLINRLGDVTPLALQKLIYYSQAFFSVLNDGKFLFSADCQAWQHGPVYPEVYSKYKEFGFNPIEVNGLLFSTPEKNLLLKELEVLDNIINTFGRFSGSALREITHLEEPWIEARRGLSPSMRSTNIIHKESILRYFTKVATEYGIEKAEDIRKYSDAMLSRI